jgi:membrane-bound lytic murein transglycosylase B
MPERSNPTNKGALTLRSLTILFCAPFLIFGHGFCQEAVNPMTEPSPQYALAAPQLEEPQRQSSYRGWDHLVEKLRGKGISEQDLSSIYGSPLMPQFSFVPFKLKPKEASSIYSGFTTDANYQLGAGFIRSHSREFEKMEDSLKVPAEVVAAILVVESQIGQNTGKELVLYRLSRVASVGDPDNLRENFEKLREEDPSVSFTALRERAQYLENTFLPEIPALIEISKRNQVDIFEMRGSIAGAMGLPQFLPSAFLKFGMDADRNGLVSLHSEVDALWSAANYLASYGFRASLSLEEKRAILWHYNKSDAYIDTILAVSRGISAALARSTKRR